MGEESATNQFKFASELERIFSSAEFTRSPVMRRLLRFLVEETLAGRGDQLKAYSVAVDGLGRDPDFDAQTDSYPRVQVGRLRRMLDAYYASAGMMNGDRMVIPNGAYRVFLQPVYRMQERPSAANAADGLDFSAVDPAARHDMARPMLREHPSVAQPPRSRWRRHAGWMALASIAALAAAVFALVIRGSPTGSPVATAISTPTLLLLPVERSPNSPAALAPSLNQVLGDALHRSWIVDVRSPQGRGGPKSTYRLQAVLAGTTGEDLYLTLWRNWNGDRIWTSHILLSGKEGNLADQLQSPIANIIGAFGVIATDQRKSLGADVRPGYQCLLKNAELRLRLGKSDLPAARKCLEHMLAATPDAPAILAVAADVNYRLAVHQPHRANKLKALAQNQAKRALLLDPYSPQAQIASAAAAVIEGNCLSAKAQGLRAVELNPYESEYQARLGMMLFQCGDPEHERYLTTARQLNPALPAIFSMPVIAAMLDRGEKQEALRLALSQTPPATMDSPLYPLTMAIAYAGAGEKAQAAYYWRQAVTAAGRDVQTPGDLLKSMLISPEMTEATGRLLLKSGVVKSLG